MATLPIEQVLQRQTCNLVTAPGVVLWGSATDDWDMATWTADVDVIDEVEDGEVELAQMADPEFFWEVVADSISSDVGPNHGPFGIFQNIEFGDFDFGDGPFGGVETEWYVSRPQYGYTMTGTE